MFLHFSLLHSINCLSLIYLTSLDSYTMSWFLFPLILELICFLRSQGIIFLLITQTISEFSENNNNGEADNNYRYFPKIYVLSLFAIIFFYFNINVLMEYIMKIYFGLTLPIFLFQILHAGFSNRKCKINLIFAFMSFSKLFIPLYFSSYDNNFLHLNYHNIMPISLITSFSLQFIILILQYNFNNKQMFPFFYPEEDRLNYNYFKTDKFLTDNFPSLNEMTCSICLCEFIKSGDHKDSNVNVIMSDNDANLSEQDLIKNNNQNQSDEVFKINVSMMQKIKFCFYRIGVVILRIITCPYYSFKFITKNIKNFLRNYLFQCYFKKSNKGLNTNLMVTPCNHLYHTPCFNSWLEQKELCPICRRELPSNEE